MKVQVNKKDQKLDQWPKYEIKNLSIDRTHEVSGIQLP